MIRTRQRLLELADLVERHPEIRPQVERRLAAGWSQLEAKATLWRDSKGRLASAIARLRAGAPLDAEKWNEEEDR